MRLSNVAIGPVLAGCALIAVTSCSTDEKQTEPGLGPSISPAVTATSAYDIVKVSGMTVDGNLADWANISAISMADNSGRTGGVDNTAKVKLAWDDTYLYAAYDVTDTELLAVQTTRDAANIYQDDGVELYVDPQGDGAGATSMTATDYQVLSNILEAMSDYNGDGAGGKDGSWIANSLLAQAAANGSVNASGTDTGYAVELRISWSDLGVTPSAGHFMRIDPVVDDRDGAGPPPTQSFDWAGLSGNYNQPSAWKDVRLVNPPPVAAYNMVKVPSMTVDGNLSDWTGISAISMADNSGRTGGVDNTAKVKLAWDDTYLYAAYDVTDTELLAVQTARDAANIYQDDGVELYVDPQGDGGASMTATDYQVLSNILEAVSDYNGNGAGGKDGSWLASSLLSQAAANGNVNAAGTDTGYAIELRVAWSDLGVTPAAGSFMRMDAVVDDRDGAGPPPTQSFDWAGLSGNYNNPDSWKVVGLVLDNTAPTAPSNPTLTVVSSSQIDVAWTASTSSDVAKYNIYRGTTGTPTLYKTVSASPYHDTGLTAGTSYTYQISAVDAAGNESPKTATKSATTTGSGGTGIPYGLFGIKADSIPNGTIWTGSTLTSKNLNNVISQLQDAKAKNPKLRMWFNIVAGDEQVFMNTDGSFNLQRWKDTLDAHVSPINADGTSSYYDDLLPYIQDGTLQGTQMLDDIANFTPDPTFAQLEAIAAHMKKRFPTLTTAVRATPSALKTISGGQRYTQLDVAWAQYRPTRGPVVTYRTNEIAAAQAVGLGLIFGMNIYMGMADNSPIPADSIRVWGSELLKAGASDYACGFMMWNVQYPNLSHSAFTTLATLAKNHVAAPCKRR